MSAVGLIAGTHTLLVGVEDQEDGGLRLYLKHRSLGMYVVVDDDETKDAVRRAWASGGHITVPTPSPDCVYLDDEEVGT